MKKDGWGSLEKQLISMNDQQLNEKIKSLAKQERLLLKEILLHISEVDQRRLYLRMAYPSLFDYLTKEIGYSAGAAHRRIDAARMIQRLPEVSSQIENGVINLSQISKVQQICRQIKKDTGVKVDSNFQKTVLEKIESKNSSQTDLILSQEFQIELKTKEVSRIQKDESVRLELTFSKEEMELVKRAQELLSNKTGGGFKATVVEMARLAVKSQNANERKMVATSTVEVKGEALLKSVTPRLRKAILGRDECCQFKDPKTGKVCGSKYFLEVDHIHPRFMKGGNEKENLRALCKSHNLFRFQANL